MTHRLKKISMLIGLSSLTLGLASAACIDHVAAHGDDTITRAGLVAYNDCLKAEMEVPKPPLKLSQSTWQAACNGGTYVPLPNPGGTNFQCLGGNPFSNSNTLLTLKVTNIYALAGLPLPTASGTYPDGSIWIGNYPANKSYTQSNTTAFGPFDGTSVQVICANFHEIGWSIPTQGLNTNYATSTVNAQISGSYSISASGAGSSVAPITMLTTPPAPSYTTLLPLYIICVGRDISTHQPAVLPVSFAINWT